MSKILIIIPAYNEEANILNTYNQILSFNNLHHTDYDVIVINDGSKDGTGEMLDVHQIPHIDLIHNLGIGGAVQTGYKYAKYNGYDIAVQFDGDGQHDVSYIKHIVDPIIKGEADFVIGSRFVSDSCSDFKSSLGRRAGIKMISVFIKITTGVKVFDTTSGFRAVNRSIISFFADSYPSEYPEPVTTTELLRKKYKFSEIGVRMHERAGGTSSIRTWKNLYYMVNVILTILVIRMRRYPHVNES